MGRLRLDHPTSPSPWGPACQGPSKGGRWAPDRTGPRPPELALASGHREKSGAGSKAGRNGLPRRAWGGEAGLPCWEMLVSSLCSPGGRGPWTGGVTGPAGVTADTARGLAWGAVSCARALHHSLMSQSRVRKLGTTARGSAPPSPAPAAAPASTVPRKWARGGGARTSGRLFLARRGAGAAGTGLGRPRAASRARRAARIPPRRPIGSCVRARAPDWSARRQSRLARWAGGAEAGMAAPGPCADGSCCTRPGARQTLDEMDFERGEAARGPGAARAPVLGRRDPSGPGVSSAPGNAGREERAAGPVRRGDSGRSGVGGVAGDVRSRGAAAAGQAAAGPHCAPGPAQGALGAVARAPASVLPSAAPGVPRCENQ